MTIRLIYLTVLFFLISANISWADIIKIYVFEKDIPTKCGFECEVYIKGDKSLRNCVLEPGKDRCIGYIDKDGFEEFELTCKPGERLLIIPSYMNMDPKCIRCPVTKELRVGFTPREIIENIITSAREAIRDENFAAAALAFLELASRVTEYQGKTRAEFEAEIYKNMAIFFNMPLDQAFQYDIKNEKVLMRNSLSQKIASYQIINKIPVKKLGQLDAKTLIVAGNVKPYQIIYNLKKSPTPSLKYVSSLESVNFNLIAEWLPDEKASNIKSLLTKVKEYEKSTPAKASLAYNNVLAEIAQTKAPLEIKFKWENNFETKVYENFGKYLNIKDPFSYDPIQNKNVMTYEMKEAVKLFQQNFNIKATGIIDFKTLSKAVKGPGGGV